MFLAAIEAGPNAAVELQVSLNQEVPNTTVSAGLFTRIRTRTGRMVRNVVANLNERCLACKMLVRMAISSLTGGADLVGDALDAAFAALEGMLDDYINDTILGQTLSILRGFVNPAALGASEVCRRLGYCV